MVRLDPFCFRGSSAEIVFRLVLSSGNLLVEYRPVSAPPSTESSCQLRRSRSELRERSQVSLFDPLDIRYMA